MHLFEYFLRIASERHALVLSLSVSLLPCEQGLVFV